MKDAISSSHIKIRVINDVFILNGMALMTKEGLGNKSMQGQELVIRDTDM